jgi:hypothetical protein
MRKAIFLLLLPTTLVGCTSTKIQSSSPNSVVVRASSDKPYEAQKFADKECSNYGKRAKLNHYEPTADGYLLGYGAAWGSFFFDCVAK